MDIGGHGLAFAAVSAIAFILMAAAYLETLRNERAGH